MVAVVAVVEVDQEEVVAEAGAEVVTRWILRRVRCRMPRYELSGLAFCSFRVYPTSCLIPDHVLEKMAPLVRTEKFGLLLFWMDRWVDYDGICSSRI